MNPNVTNIKGKQIAGVSATAYVLLCCILLFTLKCEQSEESSNMGVLVNLGTVESGMNETNTPTVEKIEEPQETNPRPPQEYDVVEEELESITQDITQTSVSASEEPNVEPINETSENEETIETREEQEPEQTVNENALFNGTNSANQGTENTSGDQGNPNGSLESDIYGDIAGSGLGSDGKGWGLKGRGLISKPQPTNPTNEYGNVTIKITVDKYGNVVNAEFTSFNSTTTNKDLVNIAIKEAYKVKFNNVQTDIKAREKQKGYVVFKFKAN